MCIRLSASPFLKNVWKQLLDYCNFFENDYRGLFGLLWSYKYFFWSTLRTLVNSTKLIMDSFGVVWNLKNIFGQNFEFFDFFFFNFSSFYLKYIFFCNFYGNFRTAGIYDLGTPLNIYKLVWMCFWNSFRASWILKNNLPTFKVIGIPQKSFFGNTKSSSSLYKNIQKKSNNTEGLSEAFLKLTMTSKIHKNI